MQAEIAVLRKEHAAKLLLRAAENEQNLDAVLGALERAQEQLAAVERDKSLPLDFRGPNGSYSSEFARMCSKILGPDRGRGCLGWRGDSCCD